MSGVDPDRIESGFLFLFFWSVVFSSQEITGALDYFDELFTVVAEAIELEFKSF